MNWKFLDPTLTAMLINSTLREQTRTYLAAATRGPSAVINTLTVEIEVPLALILHLPTMPTSSSPTHPPSDSGSTETQETFDTLKRKYDQLIRKSRKKQRSMNNPTVEERARGIRKVASLYTNISTLAAVALAQEEGGESDAEEVASEEEQRRRKIE